MMKREYYRGKKEEQHYYNADESGTKSVDDVPECRT